MDFLKELERRVCASITGNYRVERVHRVCNIIVSCLDAFNSMGADDVKLEAWDRDASLIEVPSVLSFYIKPASVRVNPLDRKTIDVLYRGKEHQVSEIIIHETVSEKILDDKGKPVVDTEGKETYHKVEHAESVSYKMYRDAIEEFYSLLRWKEGSFVTLESLRQHVSVFDTLSHASDGRRVRYFSDNPYWPIDINKEVFIALFKDNWLNNDKDEILLDYMSNLNLRSK